MSLKRILTRAQLLSNYKRVRVPKIAYIYNSTTPLRERQDATQLTFNTALYSHLWSMEVKIKLRFSVCLPDCLFVSFLFSHATMWKMLHTELVIRSLQFTVQWQRIFSLSFIFVLLASQALFFTFLVASITFVLSNVWVVQHKNFPFCHCNVMQHCLSLNISIILVFLNPIDRVMAYVHADEGNDKFDIGILFRIVSFFAEKSVTFACLVS